MEQKTTTNDLASLHAVLLEMISDIDALCRRHGLRYSLYCGTLLGAVREGDFIPWDDDADLMMPVPDYRRFFRLAQKELGEKYVIQDLENTPEHPWMWTRVFRKNTCYLRRDWESLQVHHGIALDIYPMTGAADTAAGFRLQNTVLDLSKALRHIDYWRRTGYPEKKSQRVIGKALSVIPGPVRRALSLFLERLAVCPPERKKRCGTLDGAPFAPKFLSEDWQEYGTHELAGRSFSVPVRYDKLLTVMYGDYMTPPPLSQRGGHGDHYGGALIDTERDYTYYLQKGGAADGSR